MRLNNSSDRAVGSPSSFLLSVTFSPLSFNFCFVFSAVAFMFHLFPPSAETITFVQVLFQPWRCFVGAACVPFFLGLRVGLLTLCVCCELQHSEDQERKLMQKQTTKNETKQQASESGVDRRSIVSKTGKLG